MATRVEILKDLVDVIKADYTVAITKQETGCPDCGGAGTKGTNESNITSCATCKGSGLVDMEVCDLTAMPLKLRKMVTGFKMGRQGRLLPDFRSKDKAAGDLIKVLGLDRPTLQAMRDAYGDDKKPAEVVAEEDQFAALVADPEAARAALVRQLWAIINNPTSSESSQIQANRQMSLLLGLQTEVGTITPTASMEDFYKTLGDTVKTDVA